MDPQNLKFAKSHEWVAVEDGLATVGISKFAVDALTDLVYLELPEVGQEVTAGAVFGVVESVKAASDLYAPVSGTVQEVNEALVSDPGMLSDDPWGAGWMIRVGMSNPAEVDGLMDYDAYKQHCESEGS